MVSSSTSASSSVSNSITTTTTTTSPIPTPDVSTDQNRPIQIVEPPWDLYGDLYCFAFWTSASQALHLPAQVYSPLEAASEFADVSSSRPVGGLSMVYIVRYRDSPVGPYDELLFVPGKFEWSRARDGGGFEKHTNYKISRAYVSQKHTCYNGRLNWNIPKHLAKFDWEEGQDGATTLRVYPHDTAGDAREISAASTPFFKATFKPIPYMPSFPASTSWAKYVGHDLTSAMPPLPQGNGSRGELAGTDRWCTVLPLIRSSKTSLTTFDLSQRDEHGEVVGEYENFWPGLGRWRVGVKMEDAKLSFGPPGETWK